MIVWVELWLFAAAVAAPWCTSFGWTARPTSHWNYFAYGSNMLPATMESLRNLRHYRNATAAILPDYRLTFQAGGAAAIARDTGAVVHGVLYQLSSWVDVHTISATEGVPLVYRWVDCPVVPYHGDGRQAGHEALHVAKQRRDDPQLWIPAKTLVASPLPFPLWQPRPSRSYLEILQRGAAYWNMDKSYQQYLKNQVVTSQGWEGALLELAERINPPRTARRR